MVAPGPIYILKKLQVIKLLIISIIKMLCNQHITVITKKGRPMGAPCIYVLLSKDMLSLDRQYLGCYTCFILYTYHVSTCCICRRVQLITVVLGYLIYDELTE